MRASIVNFRGVGSMSDYLALGKEGISFEDSFASRSELGKGGDYILC